MSWFPFYLTYETIGWGIRLVMVGVVLRRQLAPGASLAWLGIIFLHPYIGLALYLAVGESRLGPRRAARHREIITRLRDPGRHPDRQRHLATPESRPSYEPMVLQAQKISEMPVLSGNRIDFFPEQKIFLEHLVADINAAKSEVNLLYYIFVNDQTGRKVTDALIAAAGRGVKCRVLADAMASRKFFHRHSLARKLRAAGVEVAAALPVAPLRRRLARLDLRNHRKLAVIDGHIAHVGSHNLVNPDYGGRRGNPWVDLTGRITGPVVGELAGVFAEDWAFETGQELEIAWPDCPESGDTADVPVQVVPTGPSTPDATYRRLLMAAIQSSRQQLIITTPYFVPDEPTMLSFQMAADRGVDVKLILPNLGDQLLPAAAGRAHYQTLLHAGVSIHLYRPGLIHAKTATVDDAFALFGSANLDVRSFQLNFELSVLLYGADVTRRLREIQMDYLANSTQLTIDDWSRRNVVGQYTDRVVALMSPLL